MGLLSWMSTGASRPAGTTRRGGAVAKGGRAVASTLLSASMLAGGLAGPVSAQEVPEEPEFQVVAEDLEFILKQIKISEAHAAGGELLCADRADASGTCVPDPKLPWGLRTVDGSSNNLREGQEHFGASGEVFPRLLEPEFRDAEDLPFDPDGPMGPAQSGVPTSYAQKSGFVADSEPRIISNLIVDQTANNPAAVDAMESMEGLYGAGAVDHDNDPATPDRLSIPNVSPDEGLSAPFNSWFTLFGQFFDHGLDLVSKGGSGTVAVPLQPDDPLYDHTPGARTNFIMLTRATNQPGEDGILGTDDDVQEHVNRTTPFIDQNQTYTSHPSHQVFLREYEATPDGPVPTGHLLDGADGGLVTWTEVKAQARTLLGIELDDLDVLNVPLLATDPYGRFVPGANGYPQLVVPVDPEAPDTPANRRLVEADPSAPVDATTALRANHAFLDDIAHAAAPSSDRGGALAADDDTMIGVPEGARNVYDDELLGAHYITGDGRGNENIGLTAVHHVFHSEHNRLVGHIEEVLEGTGDQGFIAQWHDESGPWDFGERLFQAARFVTEMQYQHLAIEEFARTVQPTIDNQPLNETAYHDDVNPALTAEFAHVVYRFGHSMLTDTVARDGYGTEDLSLLDAFLNPRALTDDGRITPDQGAGAVLQGMARQTGNGIDEFVDDTLRNELLGLPLDLAAINIARGRETGMPSLQSARAAFYAATHDAALKPYDSWEDFRLSMKHRSSIVNFVAAYGNHPSLDAAETVADKRAAAEVLVADEAFMNAPAAESGLNDVDFWMGGLAEDGMVFGGLLGTTFNFVFENHMEDLQNADRFYYLTRTQGLNLISQLENNSFSALAERNTDATLLASNVFANPDVVFDLANLPDPLPAGLQQMSDGSYRYDGPEHIVMHGTPVAERMRGGDGDDSLYGHAGADNVEGGMGNDVIHGGSGDDILTDLFGDDTIHAGHGNDAINAGSGLDLLFGGFGNDYILHGNEVTQSFAGAGTDFVRGGNANDIMTGNESDDWLEGGKGHDLVQGDNALTFQNDPKGGADVLFGGSGNDDHDAEGGDDIMLNNGIDRHAGMLGFDWVTHKADPFKADSDLDVSVFQPLDATTMRARFMSVEGLSGWDRADVLRGSGSATDPAFPDGSGSELTQAHLDRIEGLRELLGGGEEPAYAAPFMTTSVANDILLGGPGSDVIEGRAGDDFIDGDAKLDVYLVGPGGERQESMQPFESRIFSGEISPADLTIVRAIVSQEDAGVVNTAVYSDVRDNYDVTTNPDGTVTVAHDTGGDETGDDGGDGDGTDTLRNIERLQFADQTVDVVAPVNTPATGAVTMSGNDPVEGQAITADASGIVDADGIDADTMAFTWQTETAPGQWAAAASSDGSATFVPTDAEVGARLRVVVTFTDGMGVTESITSEPTTGTVANVNDAPTGAPELSTANPVEGVALTVSTDQIADEDGLEGAAFAIQWQQGANGSFGDIGGATDTSFTPGPAQVGDELRVVVRYTDDHGSAELVASVATDPVAADAPAATLQRLAGANRVATSVAVSQQTFADGAAGAVVLARQDNFADALAGTPLAAEKDAPLLLTDSASLTAATHAEIERVLTPGGTVYLLGGPAALGEDVVADVEAAGYEAVRLAGANRFATAVEVAEALGDPSGIMLATGGDFADALSAGAAAVAADAAVLLTDGDRLPAVVRGYMDANPGAATYAIGGPAAAAVPGAEGISGSNRYATAVAVAERFFTGPAVVGVASGTQFPDALAGGAHIASLQGPLVLTRSTSVPEPLQAYLDANRGSIETAYVYGGDAAVRQSVADQVDAAIR